MNKICPLCENESPATEIETHFDKRFKKEYKLRECLSCGGQFWDPLKNPGSEWYETDPRYAHRNIDPHIEPNWNHRKIISFLRAKSGKASPAQRRPRVLDVGCGTGNFLKFAGDNGWKPYGIDFDKDAVRVARDVLGLENIGTETLEEYKNEYGDKKFDLITFFDLFEHIDNHNQFAHSVFEMLNPGGYIAMSMPYGGGAKWLKPHDLPPRHLTRWRRKTLTEFWRRHGFEVVYNTRRSEGIRFIILKLRFRYGKYLSFNIVGKMKESSVVEGVVKTNKKTQKKISLVSFLAKTKDLIIFGIPALIIWLIMLPTKKRYITLYMIARKK